MDMDTNELLKVRLGNTRVNKRVVQAREDSPSTANSHARSRKQTNDRLSGEA